MVMVTESESESNEIDDDNAKLNEVISVFIFVLNSLELDMILFCFTNKLEF